MVFPIQDFKGKCIGTTTNYSLRYSLHIERIPCLLFLFRCRDRYEKKQSIFPDIGRKGVITSHGLSELKRKYEGGMTSKNQLNLVTIRDDSITTIKKEQKQGLISFEPDISRFQLRRIQQIVAPEVNNNPTITNDRRVEATNDPYNAIHNLAVAMMILQPTEEKQNGRFPPELVCNIDAMSAIIGAPGKNKKVYGPKGMYFVCCLHKIRI